MFENAVLAPLVIGCAVGGIGYVFEIDDGESSQFYLNRISLSAYVLSGNHRYDFNYHNESQSSTDLRIRGIGMLMKKMYVDLNRGEFMGNCIKISKPKAQIWTVFILFKN